MQAFLFDDMFDLDSYKVPIFLNNKEGKFLLIFSAYYLKYSECLIFKNKQACRLWSCI